MKVRSHIVLLVTVVLVPIVVFSAAVLNVLLKAERAAALRSMQELARASVSIMDRELTYAMATAQTLSTSRNLHEGNLRAFYEQATEANRNHEIHAALLDENAQQIFNTIRPYGTRIGAPNQLARQRIERVLAGGRPVFSNLIKGSATGKYVLSVEFPVTVADGRRYVINEWMFSDHLNSLLPAKNVPSSWLIAVFDREGMTIARNINPARFVGSPPAEERRRTILAGFEGISRAYTRDGIEMYGAWERSSITGWSVGVGVPVSEIERTAVRSVALAASGFVIAVCLALGGALLVSGRLVRAIARATAAAELLPDYRVPAVENLRVDEMNRLQMALHRTGLLLVQGEATRRQSLEEARHARALAEEARRVAEDQNRAKDEFLAMLGHELRNPLAAIASGVALLNLPGTEGERAERARSIIARQTRHLTSLVEELLDAHRILNGKITLSMEPIDLRSAVQACLAAFETRGASTTHRIHADLGSAIVLADATRLEQMIANLLDNALKYTPAGGTIDVTVRTEGRDAVLSVADDGIGLAPELLARAFDVFVQGKVINRAKGGLGIGLAVVSSLAKQHGATLLADSAGPGKGSRFSIRFALASSGLPAQPGHPPTRDQPRQSRVLVIEDNQDVREMICMMLSEYGLDVHAADKGAAGIEAARTFLPDVAVVDIDLPDMSGYQVAGHLRQDARTAAIRLVAVTGYGQPADRQRALDAGFERHLTKPVPIDQLITAINEGAPSTMRT